MVREERNIGIDVRVHVAQPHLSPFHFFSDKIILRFRNTHTHTRHEIFLRKSGDLLKKQNQMSCLHKRRLTFISRVGS